jgi:hypothetical protein
MKTESMKTVVLTDPILPTGDYFGICPECHAPGTGPVLQGGEWYCVCDEHSLRWRLPNWARDEFLRATQKPGTTAPDSEFGLCPVCHQEGRRVDAGKAMWLVCETHRLAWPGDYGMTPQTEVIRAMDGDAAAEKLERESYAILSQCRKVTPFYWPPTLRGRLRNRIARGMGWLTGKMWRAAMRGIIRASCRRGFTCPKAAQGHETDDIPF